MRVRCGANCIIALFAALSGQETSASKQLAPPLAYTHLQTDLFPIGRHPFVAFDQRLAVGGHARFGETLRISELQFHADHLFDSVVAVVSVFRRKRSLRINARDDGFESR
jgi:hypothetical protein